MKDPIARVTAMVDLDQLEFEMTSEELFEMHKNLCEAALNLMQKKNHDYAGNKGTEPFANFTRVEALGITTTEKAMLVRMLDKMSRLASFMEAGKFKVEDEKLKDTILDMINYSILLYAYIDEKNSIPYTMLAAKTEPRKAQLQYPDTDPYDPYSKGGLVPNTPDTV